MYAPSKTLCYNIQKTNVLLYNKTIQAHLMRKNKQRTLKLHFLSIISSIVLKPFGVQPPKCAQFSKHKKFNFSHSSSQLANNTKRLIRD